MTLIRSHAIPFVRLGRIAGHALPLGAHDTEIDLGLDRAVVGEWHPFFQGDVIVALAISSDARLEISL